MHDIARFEQYARFKNYNVISNFDHGDYAVEILNKDMRKYIETDQYDDIIKIAIKNHNKYKIEEGLTEKQEFKVFKVLTHCYRAVSNFTVANKKNIYFTGGNQYGILQFIQKF